MARRKKAARSKIGFAHIFLFFFILGVIGLVNTLWHTVVDTRPNPQPFAFAATASCRAHDFSGVYEPDVQYAFFNGERVAIPQDIAFADDSVPVLGTTDSRNEQWIEVDLSEQKVYAWQGEELVLEGPVSTGKWGRTPTGEFRVWIKLRHTKMEGGDKSDGTYYNLPNVPYTMFFSNDQVPAYLGYALHGAYWHNNFGTPMSHGCVNLPIPIAEQIFNWAGPALEENQTARHLSRDEGIRVVIHE